MRLINGAIIAVTAVAVVLILGVGRTTPAAPLEIVLGKPSPQTFVANRSTDPIVDAEATAAAREAAAAAVAPVVVTYQLGDTIVEAEEPISSAQFAAIIELELNQPWNQPSTSAGIGWLVVIAGLVAVVFATVWWRVTGERWSHPRHLLPLAAAFVVSAILARVLTNIGT